MHKIIRSLSSYHCPNMSSSGNPGNCLELNWIDELAAEPSSLDRATHPGFPRTNNIIKSIIKVTVKHIDPDEKMIFAYLNKDEVPVLCSWYEWKEWWKREGDRCQVKYDRIDDWEIETRFQGRSAALDGPPLFWDVRFFSPRIVSDGARHFGTKESALAFHAEVVERIISGEFEA